MTLELQTNRYDRLTPNATTDDGVTISCPYYITLTPDQKKNILNAFRRVKTKELLEAGFQKTEVRPDSWVTVQDNTAPVMAPCEQTLEMTEDSLRYLLFSRQGLQERLFHKLCNITGLHFVSKEDILEAFRLWVESNYEQQTTKTADKPSKRTKKTVASKSTS